jgi:hypothetical protein
MRQSVWVTAEPPMIQIAEPCAEGRNNRLFSMKIKLQIGTH